MKKIKDFKFENFKINKIIIILNEECALSEYLKENNFNFKGLKAANIV